jgi:hypothetical protein
VTQQVRGNKAGGDCFERCDLEPPHQSGLDNGWIQFDHVKVKREVCGSHLHLVPPIFC